mgnify:CR=1 FL=1
MKSTSKSAGLFLVCGTTNGFGKAVAEKLISNNYSVLGIARGKEELEKIQSTYPNQFEYVAGDLSKKETTEKISKQSEGRFINGIFINAGGPPAKTIEETSMEDWDQAYETLLRWKVDLVKNSYLSLNLRAMDEFSFWKAPLLSNLLKTLSLAPP